LPQSPNLHYLGMKNYQELPSYLARFDVALVPFAMNEATRYLSPTKTLEYLAAHKPVVSTPIPDIIELYGDYVRIAATPAAFASQVEAALSESTAHRATQRNRVKALLNRHTWDSIASQMHDIIQKQIPKTSIDLPQKCSPQMLRRPARCR
jgi:glycosyltransferase involved in cell wall biosynthesis